VLQLIQQAINCENYVHPIFGQHYFTAGADCIDIAGWAAGAFWVVFIVLL